MSVWCWYLWIFDDVQVVICKNFKDKEKCAGRSMQPPFSTVYAHLLNPAWVHWKSMKRVGRWCVILGLKVPAKDTAPAAVFSILYLSFINDEVVHGIGLKEAFSRRDVLSVDVCIRENGVMEQLPHNSRWLVSSEVNRRYDYRGVSLCWIEHGFHKKG